MKSLAGRRASGEENEAFAADLDRHKYTLKYLGNISCCGVLIYHVGLSCFNNFSQADRRQKKNIRQKKLKREGKRKISKGL